ncbi:hypothetical protein EV356DRAFT_527129 [Viridothelium virens]|uniref:Amino acid transporter transmembrane domain-containing protein n=1 Tax=Viridothelium virens TaxID=1048519 RepID=A0A6A6GWT0_VIRVR|nr:hypothetical protein EV356DRAFT_527129 [Viridothelium virens]
MAKDDHDRDTAETDPESARLLSESPPPLDDEAELMLHKNPHHPLASHTNSNDDSFPLASDPESSLLNHDASPNATAQPSPTTTPSSTARPTHSRRQSSFAQHRPDGTPRTPNRVRFDVDDRQVATNPRHPPPNHLHLHHHANGFPRGGGGGGLPNGHARHAGSASPRSSPSAESDPSWLQEDDYLASPVDGTFNGLLGGIGRWGSRPGHGSGNGYGNGQQGQRGQRVPLLTDIEAPSVTVANPGPWGEEGGDEEVDVREVMMGEGRSKSGMRSAFMNMANSIIGAGIIGQPYALRQAGLFSGILLLIVLTVTVDWTIRLIVVNSKLSGANSFQATMEHCFGKSGLVAISVAQFAFAFGGMVAFCIIVGDTIPHVTAAIFPSFPSTPFLWLLTDRRAIIIIFILGISYPLSLYRDIAKLAKASTLALISMLIILITVLTQGPRVPADMKGQLRGSLLINNGVFQAVGVISFAFVCHHNSLLIYGSLKKPTLDRFARVTHWSTGISMIACLTMGVAGYLNFGDKTQGNVLNNFPSDNVMVNIARFCFGLNMLTTLPLEAFVCREVLNTYYFPHEPFQPNRHLIFSTSLVVSAMTLSLFTCDLGVVFELVGATSACALAYIFPPLCYIKLSGKKKWSQGGWERWLAGAVVAFGCTVLGISLFLASWKLAKNEGGAQTC